MKVHYDKDEDILMIVLDRKNRKRIDDTYETDTGTVSVDEDGRPLMVEIFNAKQFFAQESKVLPREIKQKFFSSY